MVLAASSVVFLWAGAVWAGVRHLIRSEVGDTVRTELDRQMQPLRLEFKALTGEVGRVRLIEQKIENGLSDRTRRIEERQERMESKLDTAIAQITVWDGTPRRSSDR